jgi:DNA end-binding protein Ku
VNETTDEPVPPEHIVKGIELDNRGCVVIDDEELSALKPAMSKEIAVLSFVPADQVPALLYDTPYHLIPGKFGAKPYVLLARALAETGTVAIGRLVMRQKSHLCAVRSDGQHLAVSTMVFPDEVVEHADVEDEETTVGDIEMSERELKMARGLVEALSEEWQPEAFRDTYRDELMALIDAKAAGHTFSVQAVPDTPKVVDLASALEASVAAANATRKRHPTAHVPTDTAKQARPRKRKSA